MKQKNADRLKPIIFIVSPIILIALLIIGMLVYQLMLVKKERRRLYAELDTSAVNQGGLFCAAIESRFSMLELYAETLAQDGLEDAEKEAAQLRNIASLPEARSICVADQSGVSYSADGVSFYVADRKYYQSSMVGRRALELVPAAREAQKALFVMSVPVICGGEPAGILSAGYDQAEFEALLGSDVYAGRGGWFLCGGDGGVIAGGGTVICPDNVCSVMGIAPGGLGEKGNVQYELGGEGFTGVYNMLGINDWALFNVIPSALAETEISAATRSGIVAAALFSGVAFFTLLLLLIYMNGRARAFAEEKKRIMESEERFKLVAQNSAASIWDYDIPGRAIIQNAHSMDIHGFGERIEDVPESLISCGYIHPQSAEAYREMYGRLLSGQARAEGVFRVRSGDGKGWRYESVRYVTLFDAQGKPYRAIGMSQDVTEKFEAQLEYEQEMKLLRMIAPDIYSMTLFNVTSGERLRYSTGAPGEAELFDGLDFEQYLKKLASLVQNDADVRRYLMSLDGRQLRERFQSGDNTVRLECLRDTQSGAHWMNYEVHLMPDPGTGDLLAFEYVRDIDEQKREMEGLFYAAEHDLLTGFYNCDAFIQRAGRYVKNEGSVGVHALFMIDADEFGSLSDRLGRELGDGALRDVSEVIAACFTETDILGRILGDRFAVLMKNASSLEAVRDKAAQLVEALQFACAADGRQAELTACAGASVTRPGRSDVQQLMGGADEALFKARSEPGRYYVSSPFEEGQEQAKKRPDTIRLGALLENMEGGVLLVEAGDDVRIKYSSPSFFKARGRVPGESGAFGSELLGFVLKDDLEAFYAALRRAVTAGAPVDHQYRVTEFDGSVGWRHIRIAAMPETGPQDVLGVVSDVTALVRSNALLRLSEERYRMAMKQTGICIWEVDLAKRCVHTSINIDGVGEIRHVYENFPGSIDPLEIVNPRSANDLERMFDDLLRGDDSHEYTLLQKRGAEGYVWVKACFTLLRNDDGAPYYSIGILDPVPNIETERRRFERELVFEKAISGALTGFLRVDLSRDMIEYAVNNLEPGRPEYKNRPYSGLIKKRMELAAGDDDADVIEKKLSGGSLLTAFKKGREWALAEFKLRRAGGGIGWVSVSANLIREPVGGDVYAFIYVRDTDAVKHMELSLPFKAERDAASRLYDAASFKALAEAAAAGQKEDGGLCALCVTSLMGVDRIKEEKGQNAFNSALFAVGRLYRIMLDSSAFVGRIDENRLAVFRWGLSSAREQRQQLLAINRHIELAWRQSGTGDPLELASGFDTEFTESADYDAMLQRALAECGNAEAQARLDTAAIALAADDNQEDEPDKRARLGEAGAERSRDAQTGLMTRQDYYQTLESIKPDSISSLGAMFVDINQLGRLNHEYGMQYGDKIIEFIAETLADVFGADSAYRVSGDEFLVLCGDRTQERFFQQCAEAVRRFDEEYPGGISTGETWSRYISSVQQLVDQAEELMAAGKEKNYKKAEGGQKNAEQLHAWLDLAIDEGRIKIYLQPKADAGTGSVLGCEALVRYDDPEKGITLPGRFLPQLERENLIKYLDYYMFEQALTVVESWMERGAQPINIAVNFSRKTLLDPGAFDRVQSIAAKHGRARQYIEIEVTETIGSIERATVVRVCEAYRNAGYKLSLDDFGSEYSSLYVLSAMRFDEIKIDKSVINDIATSRMSRLIVSNTLNICYEMNIRSVAEGVETQEQIEVLRELGCNMIQGYIINKPLPAEDFYKKYVLASA